MVEADLNWHAGKNRRCFEEQQREFSYGERNKDCEKMLDFIQRLNMKIMNIILLMKEEHLIFYNSGGNYYQIDFLLVEQDVHCKKYP